MDADLRIFVSQMTGAVAAALWPVVLTAFLSMPYTLQRHPGEPPAYEPGVLRHLT